ncbi:hypothetical protein GGS20DRAFT_170726 [Poronia punctata]|nr:hypothetical protein GGS20DRAFT_170726 [Poronia punctata]
MKSFYLIPLTLASLVLSTTTSPPSIYILTPSPSALRSISSALDTLGYYSSSSSSSSSDNSYTVLTTNNMKNISRENPEARFILPQSDKDDYPEEFFSDMGHHQLLVLDVGSDARAHTWVTLCEFLGLGYSVVERLKLWRFPQ